MTTTREKIDSLTTQINSQSEPFRQIVSEVNRVLVGQDALMHRMLVGLLTGGHLLIEGVPGLAKTTAVASLAKAVNTGFQRLQFTPDLLPADLIGTQIYRPQDQSFVVQKGPIFSNLILADEINRAPAKVQSALLEAMQEKQVTIGDETFELEEPFLVMATQNPVEQEGTYPLPEAQIDRFMLKVNITYPSRNEEKRIMERFAARVPAALNAVISPKDILDLRQMLEHVYIDDKVLDYIVDIVYATRQPKDYNLEKLETLIEYGASPRASIFLNIAARAHAMLQGRAYATPQDVKSSGMDILRHRVIVTYEAEAEEQTSEDVIRTIFDEIPVP